MVETKWLNLAEETFVSSEKEVELDISAGNIFGFEERKTALQVGEERKKEKRKKLGSSKDTVFYCFCLIQNMAMCVFITPDSYFLRAKNETWIHTMQLRIFTFIS